MFVYLPCCTKVNKLVSVILPCLALKLAQAFTLETSYTVWSDLTSSLGSVGLLLQYTDSSTQYKAWQRALYSHIAGKLGWQAGTGESESDIFD